MSNIGHFRGSEGRLLLARTGYVPGVTTLSNAIPSPSARRARPSIRLASRRTAHSASVSRAIIRDTGQLAIALA
jgi:hypothetical protein